MYGFAALYPGGKSIFFEHTGLSAGTVVITDIAVDSFFRPQFEQVVLGKVIIRSTELDEDVAQGLLQYSSELPDIPTVIGNTMCTHDFYEGKVIIFFFFFTHTGFGNTKHDKRVIPAAQTVECITSDVCGMGLIPSSCINWSNVYLELS